MKYYKIVRIVEEIYEVAAHSKEEAWNKVQDPSIVRIVKEKITLLKK